jgi:MAF protein
MTPLPLVLASTSPFRRSLLEKLGQPFATLSPNVNETRRPAEGPQQLVRRLAEAKSRAAARSYPRALIVGSDQVACIDGEILGKPGSREHAIEQLTRASGKEVVFHTGLCLLNSATNRVRISCEPFHVHFRTLDPSQIRAYVNREQPYNCAGSFKSEGLGIALFRKLEGDDPNTLIGLPMIRLVEMLAHEGLDVLATPTP